MLSHAVTKFVLRARCALLSRLTFVLLCTCFLSKSLIAQVDPRGKIRTLKTLHFRVHYPVALDSLARRAAVEAENAWTNLSTELAPPAGPVDLLLQDNVDQSNGFAQTFPTNRITIYVLPPIAVAELRFHDEWLRLVITHELTHIFHLDRARGLWRLGRNIFGRDPALFPNQLLPSWIQEGTAVHYESKFTGSGRIVSTESRVVATAAARTGTVLGPEAWSSATTRFPEGQIPYSWGSMLMHREAERSDSGMRKFVDYTATFPVPFLLNRAAKRGFGETFSKSFGELRDSLVLHAPYARADEPWKPLAGTDSNGGRYAAYPRWRDSTSLEWVASNGRDVTSLYIAKFPATNSSGAFDSTSAPVRVARRNSLDVNAPMGRDGSVYSQIDYTDPYTLRSDLYIRDQKGDRRLTHGARLIHPDVRQSDSAIVAVQLVTGGTRIVRVGESGVVTPITSATNGDWAEPRWSPVAGGNRIVAVQILHSGIQRIVLLDSLGQVVTIAAEARAVLATPSFYGHGYGLVWATDRSGRMQIDAAVLGTHADSEIDTLWRATAYNMLPTSTGVYQPEVSVDGRSIAALLYRDGGYVVAVAKFKAALTVEANENWYSNKPYVADTTPTFTGASASYHALRQLIPRYWQPVIGQARDGGSSFGAYTSSADILGRHSYTATAQLNPRSSEIDANADYRYAGLGRPVLDFTASQNWDATFRSTDSLGTTLGLIGRRINTAGLALTWSVPHVRWAASYSVGAQYEMRHFKAEVDSLLGASNSLLRTGTRYPSLFVSGSVSTLARAGRAFSAEQGVSASGNVSFRKREGGANSDSWRSVGVLRAFQPLPLQGYAKHVLAVRVAGGITDVHAPSELSIGGVSGVLTEVVPGVSFGDPSRTFPIRGFAPGSERGIRALSGTFEYRAPLALVSRGAGLFPVFLDKLSVNAFGDAARAWCPSSAMSTVPALCDARGVRDGWLASIGGELNIDLALQYDVPYRLRVGFAKPVAAPLTLSRKPSFFVTLGAFF